MQLWLIFNELWQQRVTEKKMNDDATVLNMESGEFRGCLDP